MSDTNMQWVKKNVHEMYVHVSPNLVFMETGIEDKLIMHTKIKASF